MHPALNYRQSRRSACDRCRGFKLRCERDRVSGRSCERCLKAQVVCTTSLGHSTSGFSSSKASAPTLPSEYEESFYGHDRLFIPALYNPTLSRVRKPIRPSGILRMHDSQNLSSWGDFDSGIYLGNGSAASQPHDFALPLQQSISLSAPPEHLLDADTSWNSSFSMQSIGKNLLAPGTHTGYQLPVSNTLTTGPLSSCSNEYVTNGIFSSNTYPCMEPHNSPDEDAVWNPIWRTWNASAGDDDAPIACFENSTLADLQTTQKSLIHLSLELIEDIELLELESTAQSSMKPFSDNMNSAIGKLDIPIFRMLNHSISLLEIFDSKKYLFDGYTGFYPATEPVEKCSQGITQSPKRFATDETTESGIATVSSHDSGYLTAMLSPQYANDLSLPRNKLPVFLSMLTTYCHLIRLYHAIFTQLYQIFLITPPPEDSRFFLLSNSQYRQFGMDGGLSIQVRRLVEVGFGMLAKLEQALEMQSEFSSETDLASSPRVSIGDKFSLAAIREQIIAHEGILPGIPLKETMHCLSQLVKASAEL